MTIEFHCTECGNLARTPDAMAGRTGRCPKCNAKMKIPERTELDGIDEDDLLLGFQDGDSDSNSNAPIEFMCKGCHQLVRTPFQSAGKKGKCPHCKAIVRIPKQSTWKKDQEDRQRQTVAEKKPAKQVQAATQTQPKKPALGEPPRSGSSTASIEFDCQSCGQQVRTPGSAAGKKGKCPHCDAVVNIPSATPAPKSKAKRAQTPAAKQPAAKQSAAKQPAAKQSAAKQSAASGGNGGIEFDCPSCAQLVRTPPGSAGKKGKCPHCGLVLKIPTNSRKKPSVELAVKSQQAAAEDTRIRFRCPNCEQEVATPAHTAGKKGKCPHCDGFLQIPNSSKPSQSASKPSQSASTPAQRASTPAPQPTLKPSPQSPLDGLAPVATPGLTPVSGLTPLAASPAAADLGQTPNALSPSSGSSGLTPLVGAASGSGLTPVSTQAPSNQGSGGLTPVAEGAVSGGLTPLNQPPASAGLTPIAGGSAASGLTPLAPSEGNAGSGLTPLPNASAGLTPSSPGLTPLPNASAGLTPLPNASAGLTPVGGGGLTPLGGGGDNPYDWASAESSAAPVSGGMPSANPFGGTSGAKARSPDRPVSDEGRSGLPWEMRRGDSKFTRTVKLVLFQPSEAFSRMRCSGGLGGPLGYLCVSLITVILVYFAIFLGLFLLGGMVMGTAANAPDSGQMGRLLSGGVLSLVITTTIVVFIGIPSMVISAFILSGIIHVVLMMMGSARRSFEATFRVVCFSLGSVTLIYLIPCVSMFLVPVFYFLSLIIGVAKAHEISGGKATVAVIVPSLLPSLFFLWNLFMSVMGIVSAAGGG